ncbi:hypothetical protein [Acidithiobacillus ferrianus]|uniref:hypothetical protein n=1 Tax=Acidithiobacillus ferrianus TaxID=2678518 RepID=UPI0034E42EA8
MYRKTLFAVLVFAPVMAFAAITGSLSDARALVSGYTHGAGSVVRLMPGPKGLEEIVYRVGDGKTQYGWMTTNGQAFIPATTCVVDFYGPGVGDDLCDTVAYFHGHWRHVYAQARQTYLKARGR